MTVAPTILLRRGPQTDDELWRLIRALWGITLPREQVCPDHTSPFQAVADAYFARPPGYAVWYASRGSGKSLALAVLGLTKTFVDDVNCTILGGSMTQSQNVAAHMQDLLHFERAPVYALKGGSVDKGVTATQITMQTGKWLKPIPASQTTVRGPHPPLTLLDEIDEMEWKIYEASLGQSMEQLNSRGELIAEYIVASSTWQNPLGTMTKVIDDARKKGLPVHSWCWRELLQANGGWMSQRFIDQKRNTVTEEMWRTEYELNEPSGDSRAFDLTKLEEAFVAYPTPIHYDENGEDDQTWVWEDPVPNGEYAVGADWAQEKDKTVIACARIDIFPRRLVYLRRVNRQPYPVMLGAFDKVVETYRANGMHDSTGVGSMVKDYLESGDDQVGGFNFSGKRKRSKLLLEYVAAVEHGVYQLPRGGSDSKANRFLADFHRGHRGTTQSNVYGTHKDTATLQGKEAGHLPDDVAAMALCHRAAGHVLSSPFEGVPTSETGRKVTEGFTARPFADTGGDTPTGDWEYSGWDGSTDRIDPNDRMMDLGISKDPEDYLI